MKKWILILSILIIFITGCNSASKSTNPAWVDRLIKKFESQPIGNPPQSIWSYEYQGRTVYYIPAQCCDQYSRLYNTKGKQICAPDGGLTGSGDGKCTDFMSKRSNEHLIWKDSRTP